MFRTVLLLVISLVALSLVGCGTVGKNITEVAGPNPKYLTKAEIIDLISGKVLHEKNANAPLIRRYMKPSGATVAMMHSSRDVVQKTYYGTWSVTDDGQLITDYDLDHLTKDATYNPDRPANYNGRRAVRIVQLREGKYASVRADGPMAGQIYSVWSIEWLGSAK